MPTLDEMRVALENKLDAKVRRKRHPKAQDGQEVYYWWFGEPRQLIRGEEHQVNVSFTVPDETTISQQFETAADHLVESLRDRQLFHDLAVRTEKVIGENGKDLYVLWVKGKA